MKWVARSRKTRSPSDNALGRYIEGITRLTDDFPSILKHHLLGSRILERFSVAWFAFVVTVEPELARTAASRPECRESGCGTVTHSIVFGLMK